MLTLLLFVWTLLCQVEPTLSTNNHPSSSVAHTVFLKPTEDPFMDPYIEAIVHMDGAALMSIPQMDDEQFLFELARGIDTVGGIALRNVDLSIFNDQRDDQLASQDKIDKEWEDLMISGPLIVNYVGNLMVLASKRDFPFIAPANYVFRYIRYPNSFRATLAQVSSDMYNALIGAHTAMDRIQLAIQQVPTHIKTTLKLITSSSPNMIKTMLPRSLDSIGRLANESAATARATLLKFELLQDLLSEIIELSTTTQSGNEASILEMEKKKQESLIAQQGLAATIDSIHQHYQASRTALEEARNEYNKVMRLVEQSTTPTKPKKAKAIIGKILGVISKPLETIGCIFGFCAQPQPVDNTQFENALKSAELARARLKEAEIQYDAHFQQQLAAQNELTQSLSKMAMLDLNKLSTEEIVALLLEATEQIHVIKEQWARLIRFFSKLSAQADNAQQIITHDLIRNINAAQAGGLLLDPTDREFFVVEILVPVATEIDRGAHLLYTMATTYYAVSSEYMIDQIAGIGKLLLLSNDADREAHLKIVSSNTAVASAKISRLVQERQAIYLENMHVRQKQYEQYIADLMALELEETTIN